MQRAFRLLVLQPGPGAGAGEVGVTLRILLCQHDARLDLIHLRAVLIDLGGLPVDQCRLVRHLRLVPPKRRRRLVHRSLEIAWINAGQNIPGVDLLIIIDIDADDLPPQRAAR